MGKTKKLKKVVSVAEAVAQYEKTMPRYQEFTLKLRNLIEDIIRRHDIAYDMIESRTKEVANFKSKIERPGKSYSDPINDITDLAGIRVVLFYPEDVDKVCDIINQEFIIDRKNSIDKRNLLKPHEIGYLSVHYVVALSPTRKSLLEWSAFENLRAEIQIRTVLQHAWASISRALDYTREREVPSELRRRLFLLSGLLEIADQEFSSIRKKQQILTRKVSKKLKAGETNIELNSNTLAQYFKKSQVIDQIYNEALKLGFVDSDQPIGPASIIPYCQVLGINTIGDLERLLMIIQRAASDYLKQQYDAAIQEAEKNAQWSPYILEWLVNPTFIIILLLIGIGKEAITLELLQQNDFDAGVALRLLSVARNYDWGMDLMGG